LPSIPAQDEAQARHWREQAFPVMLLLRNGEGELRWMDVREYLRREHDRGERAKPIVFAGERFDVMSVRRWRERMLSEQEG
jgi:hypothetical protein